MIEIADRAIRCWTSAAGEHIHVRVERRHQREQSSLRRDGSGRLPIVRVPAIAAPVPEQALDDQIVAIQRALDEHGTIERGELAALVGSRYWGHGVFGEALRGAVADGDVSRNTYAPARSDNAGKSGQFTDNSAGV